MNFQFYVEKLFSSKDFQEFKKENKDAFPCSGFFVFDKVGKDNKQHFDYYVPLDGKKVPQNSPENDSRNLSPSLEDKEKNFGGRMFSFQLESNGAKVPVEMIEDSAPEPIAINLDFDFKDVESLISEKMNEENIKNEIQKYLFSLQKKDGKHYLVGTVFLSRMGMLKIAYCIEDRIIRDFKKMSFFDIMKVRPGKKD